MKNRPNFQELLKGFVADRVADDLARFGELLEGWGAKHNLVKVGSRQELVERHFLEALTPVKSLPQKGRLLDVGSGAGLPGVPILCAMRGWSGVLLEPRTKRWAFLKLVVRELGLDVEVRRLRYEDLHEGEFDLITARAVGGHEALVAWAMHHLKTNGQIAIWSTEEEEKRLQNLGRWSVLSSPVVGLDRGRLLFIQVSST